MHKAHAGCLPLFAFAEVTRSRRLGGGGTTDRQRGNGVSTPLPQPWGEARAEQVPLLQGSQMAAETQARTQLPATKVLVFSKNISRCSGGQGGSLSCSCIPPRSQQVFSHFPTELWSCCSQNSKSFWICRGFLASP